MQTGMTRTFLASATILAPGTLLFYLEKSGRIPFLLPKIFVELGLLTTFLLFGLPMSVAAYKQYGKVNAKDLEAEFKDLKLSSGK